VENPLTDIDQIEQIADPVERAREIGRRLVEIPKWQERLREIRRAAVLELRAQRYTYADIAKELGLHRNRVQQIAEGRSAGGQGGPGGGKIAAPTES
jgi:DNA-directed RNA polymerase specialized sigma24 family protein